MVVGQEKQGTGLGVRGSGMGQSALCWGAGGGFDVLPALPGNRKVQGLGIHWREELRDPVEGNAG